MTDQAEKAKQILAQNCHVEQCQILEDSSICIYDKFEQPAQINRILIENGVNVSYLAVEGQDMEMYFVEKMGGM